MGRGISEGLAVLARLLIGWRRANLDAGLVFGRYLILAGGARFLIEFVCINVRVALGLTVAQYRALTLAAVGAVMIVRTGTRSNRWVKDGPARRLV